MSQHFKSKYDQMRENSQSTDPESQNYGLSENGPVRNICFVLENGSKTFLNYGYLISGNINQEGVVVVLSFTSHKVRLEGYNLENIFNDFINQTTRVVKTLDQRYLEISKNQESIIKNILITEI